jgi:RNA polymerase sigma-70 factor (ECF subfamily)
VSFEALFHRMYPSLFRYAYRLTGDADAADDVAQESFVRLLDHAIPTEQADTWLFTVVTNLVRQGGRKTARQKGLLSIYPVAPAAPAMPDEATERGERVRAVQAALVTLPPRDQQMLLMRQEGFSYAEIASAVGVAPGSVGTLLVRALERFAQTYGNKEGLGEAHG